MPASVRQACHCFSRIPDCLRDEFEGSDGCRYGGDCAPEILGFLKQDLGRRLLAFLFIVGLEQ